MMDVELDLPFITALLATLGFSVNDTIVILDRVRENIRLQKANETFEAPANTWGFAIDDSAIQRRAKPAFSRLTRII